MVFVALLLVIGIAVNKKMATDVKIALIIVIALVCGWLS